MTHPEMTPLNGLEMTQLYITCENWESLKGIKEPQISAQDPQERKKKNPIPPLKKSGRDFLLPTGG